MDTEADKRLEAIGTEDALALRGKLAIANAKLAYQNYLEAFSSDRWKVLEAKGATRQRCLWASTSTKNPEYRDVLYVEELIGPETVDTMPEETIQAFQDHGEVAETLTQGTDEAKEVFERLAAVGVDYDDVSAVLEKEGVEKFSDSFAELMEGINSKRGGARLGMTEGQELVERIWARDTSVWTGSDEDQWLGWLDEPFRELDLSAAPVGEYEHYVLLGMGGSSLAPEVFRRSFDAANFHVLDTTHPTAIRRLQESIDVGRTFFVASSKSGTTLETRSHLEHFWAVADQNPEQFAVVTDPAPTSSRSPRSESSTRSSTANRPSEAGTPRSPRSDWWLRR